MVKLYFFKIKGQKKVLNNKKKKNNSSNATDESIKPAIRFINSIGFNNLFYQIF